MKAVKCPLCGGKPQYVYLAPNKNMQDANVAQDSTFKKPLTAKEKCMKRMASDGENS